MLINDLHVMSLSTLKHNQYMLCTLCHGLQLFMNVITFRMRPKLHRYRYFVPQVYPGVMMFEEVHMSLTP